MRSAGNLYSEITLQIEKKLFPTKSVFSFGVSKIFKTTFLNWN